MFMKTLALLFICAVLLPFASVDALSRIKRRGKKDLTFQFQTGLRFSPEIGDIKYDTGYDIGLGVEKRQKSGTAYYGGVYYSSLPEKELHYNSYELESSVSEIGLYMGASWYFLENDLSKGIAPYFCIEACYGLLTHEVEEKGVSNSEKEKMDSFLMGFAAGLGASYPLSDLFIVTGSMKYHLSLLDETDGGYSSSEISICKTPAFRAGIGILFN